MPQGELQKMQTDASHECTVKGKKSQSQFTERKLQLDLRKKGVHKGNEKVLEQVVQELWETVLGDFSKLRWTGPWVT